MPRCIPTAMRKEWFRLRMEGHHLWAFFRDALEPDRIQEGAGSHYQQFPEGETDIQVVVDITAANGSSPTTRST